MGRGKARVPTLGGANGGGDAPPPAGTLAFGGQDAPERHTGAPTGAHARAGVDARPDGAGGVEAARSGVQAASAGLAGIATPPFRRRVRAATDRFDPGAAYVWSRSTLFGGVRTRPGAPVDAEKVRGLKLRSLWAAGVVQVAARARRKVTCV